MNPSRGVRSGCPSGKRAYSSYAAALAALGDLDDRGQLRGPVGSVYGCAACDGWHVSSRKFTLTRRRGRGKRRRGLVEDVG